MNSSHHYNYVKTKTFVESLKDVFAILMAYIETYIESCSENVKQIRSERF